MESEKCIEDLPDDILVAILSYVSISDLVHSVQHVCTRWKELSGDVMLWKNHIYSPEYLDSDASVTSILKQTPMLKTLIINKRAVVSDVLWAIGKHCSKLRKLIFFERQKLSTKLLKTLVPTCSNLQYLDIPHCVSWDVRKMKLIGKLSNLKVICLGGWEDEEKPVVLQPLADGCPSLEKIDMKNKLITYDDFAYFLLKKKDQLDSLDMKWGSGIWKCLIPPLTVCTRLRKLTICDYSNLNIVAGFRALGSLHSITSLTLRSLNDADITCVISVFNKHGLKQLEDLRIIDYDSYDDRLANMITRNCSKLKLLYLKNCRNLTDQSVKNFYLLHDLRSVNLTSSCITDEGVAFLVKCRKLEYLNLSCCNLTEASWELIVQFGNLHVLKLDSCNIIGLPLNLFPSCFPHLTFLSICNCWNADVTAIAYFKHENPHIEVEDLNTNWSQDQDYEDPFDVEDHADDEPVVEIDHEDHNVTLEDADPVAGNKSLEDEDLELLLGVECLFNLSSEEEV